MDSFTMATQTSVGSFTGSSNGGTVINTMTPEPDAGPNTIFSVMEPNQTPTAFTDNSTAQSYVPASWTVNYSGPHTKTIMSAQIYELGNSLALQTFQLTPDRLRAVDQTPQSPGYALSDCVFGSGPG